jgi:outer membrane protein OmpA-like peptidoglycan-associated protein
MRPKTFLAFTSCWLVLLAQPQAAELTGSVLDLKYQSLGLVNTIEDLKREVRGMDVKETDLELKINLSGDILFDFDKADLRPAAEPVLAQVVILIQKYPRARVLIEGYTDAKGNQPYNFKLSDRRAVSVKKWLATKGIPANNIATRGWGSAKPIAPNSKPDGTDDPDGRQKNRRVELTIKK